MVSLEDTRAIGGRVGGNDEDGGEGGRSSGLRVDSWGCVLRGENSREGCCSGMGEVGFEEPLLWKRRWDNILLGSYGSARGQVCVGKGDRLPWRDYLRRSVGIETRSALP